MPTHPLGLPCWAAAALVQDVLLARQQAQVSILTWGCGLLCIGPVLDKPAMGDPSGQL